MTRVAFLCCVFLPFGLGHFMSVLLRMVGGVTAPEMVARFGLGPGSLGVLSGAYFLGFALAQLPVGLALDRYGPRRVQLTLLPLAALACWSFGQASSFTSMVAARFILGAGLGGCFMAAVKASACWGARARLPTINSWLIALGGLGGAAATLPVQLLLDTSGWHGLFRVLGLLLILVALLIALLTPETEKQSTVRGRPLSRWSEGLATVSRNPEIRRIVGLLAVPHMVYFGLQGLWLGRWLHDAGGLSSFDVAWQLYLCMVGGIFGAIGVGLLAERIEARGVPILHFAATGTGIFVTLQLMMAFSWSPSLPALAVLFCVTGAITGLEYTLVARAVPKELAGRASTCLNLVVFTGAFAVQSLAGLVAVRGYGWMFGALAMVQLPGLLAYVVGLRRAALRDSDRRSTSVESSPSLMVKGGASKM